MEKIQINEDMKSKLIASFKKMKRVGIAFVVIGILGFTPLMASIISGFIADNTGFIFTGSPTIGFLGIGIIYISQAEAAAKKIGKDEFQVFTTKCVRRRLYDYAVVQNNEILSPKMTRPLKWVLIASSARSIKPEDEIGIVQVDRKTFYAFALNEQVLTKE